MITCVCMCVCVVRLNMCGNYVGSSKGYHKFDTKEIFIAVNNSGMLYTFMDLTVLNVVACLYNFSTSSECFVTVCRKKKRINKTIR